MIFLMPSTSISPGRRGMSVSSASEEGWATLAGPNHQIPSGSPAFRVMSPPSSFVHVPETSALIWSQLCLWPALLWRPIMLPFTDFTDGPSVARRLGDTCFLDVWLPSHSHYQGMPQEEHIRSLMHYSQTPSLLICHSSLARSAGAGIAVRGPQRTVWKATCFGGGRSGEDTGMLIEHLLWARDNVG